MTDEIEFEQVTVKVPKIIVSWFRHRAQNNKTLLEEEIQYEIIDSVRSNMEAMAGEEIAKTLDFGDIFYKLLDDKHYKPTTDQEVKESTEEKPMEPLFG
jgi:hypothetical protein